MFGPLGLAKFCPKQEIFDIIAMSKETNELWLKCYIPKHGMKFALWKMIFDYFKIETILLQNCHQQHGYKDP